MSCYWGYWVQIVLLRHGMPKVDKDRRLNAAEFGGWVSEYNAAGIDTDCRPPQPAIEQASKCNLVVCSNLPRSLESARALGIETIGICESAFREMDMPYANLQFPRLSLSVWSVLFRLMWVGGYSANAESFDAARERARNCAERLMVLASIHDSVLLVGHGSLNWFVARYLKSMGWTGPRKAPRKYWEFGVYSYQAT